MNRKGSKIQIWVNRIQKERQRSLSAWCRSWSCVTVAVRQSEESLALLMQHLRKHMKKLREYGTYVHIHYKQIDAHQRTNISWWTHVCLSSSKGFLYVVMIIKQAKPFFFTNLDWLEHTRMKYCVGSRSGLRNIKELLTRTLYEKERLFI